MNILILTPAQLENTTTYDDSRWKLVLETYKSTLKLKNDTIQIIPIPWNTLTDVYNQKIYSEIHHIFPLLAWGYHQTPDL